MIKKLLLDYCREKGINLRDLRKDLLDITASFYEDSPMDSVWGKDYDLEDPRHKKLSEFHGHLVQETIDFINTNPDIKEMIESKGKEVEGKLGFRPDTRVYFGIDCLEESLKSGKWTPYSDSSLGLYVGGINVILDA